MQIRFWCPDEHGAWDRLHAHHYCIDVALVSTMGGVEAWAAGAMHACTPERESGACIQRGMGR